MSGTANAATVPAANRQDVNYSYIKDNNPSLYEFFLDYWKFIKGYWRVYDEEDWWNCLISDMDYYISKYSWSGFCVDLLMDFYDRCKSDVEQTETIQDTSKFLKEWWRYINKYYKRGGENDEWWSLFLRETGELTEKYKKVPYYCTLVDEFVKLRVRD